MDWILLICLKVLSWLIKLPDFMSNINIVAVATLSDASCIVLAEDVDVESGIIDKANSQNVVILKTAKTSYEAAVDYYKLSSKNV